MADQFAALKAKHDLNQRLVDWLVDANGLGAKSLNDFMFAITAESEAVTLVDAAGVTDSGEKLRQTTRVRQAWVALRKASTEAERLKLRGSDDVDMDALLPQGQLDAYQDNVWVRYKTAYPPWLMPSDLLISRLAKEVQSGR